jgi:CMP-N,N'-diacetyllegionaminic acid synthase
MCFLAIIPARGGSKGIPRKNIAPLCGRPLIAYSIEAAQASKVVDRIVVSTDDLEISEVSRSLGAEVRIRPSALAMDDTPTRAVLHHVVSELAGEGYEADAVLTLQPTSPLRTSKHIVEAVALFQSIPEADSLVSCIPVPHFFHPLSVMKKDRDGFLEPYFSEPQPYRRQDKEAVFARNGAAIYITRTKRLAEYVFGGKLVLYLMDEQSSVDIDTITDLARAEQLLLAHR